MKTKSIYIGLITLCTLLTSCEYESIKAAGEVTEVSVNFSDYTSLKVSDDFNVFVTFSDTEENITIKANENIQSRIRIYKEDNTLIVRLENNTNVRGNATMSVYITTKNITNYRVSGDSEVSLENELITENATIRLSGDSRFNGEMNVGNLDLRSIGDSDTTIFGTINSLDASLSGDSKLLDYDLVVKDLKIKLAGDSDASLSVTESIDVEARGDSVLRYKGDAVITRENLSGDSKILKKD